MPAQTLLSSVLVPMDFSSGSKQALARALRLPLGPKSKLTLLHVVPDDIPGRLRKEALAEAERNLEKAVADARPQLTERGLSTRQFVVDVVEGSNAHHIVKRAHTVEADVICMGRHGRNSLLNLHIGSTAVKVVKEGDVPVLLVRNEVHDVYRRALIAVDLTLSSPRVVKTAKPFVAEANELDVLHASSVPYEDYVVTTGLHAEASRQSAIKEAKKDLELLMTKTGLNARAQVLGGDARLLIIEEAKTRQAELIVVGTHDRKGVRKLIMGSVAEWIMTHAPCDVLVTHS